MLAQDPDNRIPPQIPVFLETSILNGRTLYAIVKDGCLMTVESSHKIDAKFIDARTTQLKNKLLTEGVRRIQTLIHTVDWEHTKWLYLEGDLSTFEDADVREYELFPCDLRKSLYRIKALPWASIIHESDLVVEKWVSAAERVCRWRGQQVAVLMGWNDITLQRVERAMEGYRMLAGRADYPGLHEVLAHVVDDDGFIVGMVTELPASARPITYDDMELVSSSLSALERDYILLRGVEGDNLCVVDRRLCILTPQYVKYYPKSERQDFWADKKGHHDFSLDLMFKYLKRLQEHNSVKIPRHLRERAFMMIAPIPDLPRRVFNAYAVPNRQMLRMISTGYRSTCGAGTNFSEHILIQVRMREQSLGIIPYDAILALFDPDYKPAPSKDDAETPLSSRAALKHNIRPTPYNSSTRRSVQKLRSLETKFVLFKENESDAGAALPSTVRKQHRPKKPTVYRDEDEAIANPRTQLLSRKLHAHNDEPPLYRPPRTTPPAVTHTKRENRYSAEFGIYRPTKVVLSPPRITHSDRAILYLDDNDAVADQSHKVVASRKGKQLRVGPIIASSGETSDDEHVYEVGDSHGRPDADDAPIMPKTIALASYRRNATRLLLRNDQ